jgi:hypothetical protein
VDNIKMDLRDRTRRYGMEWSGSGQGPVNTVLNLRVPKNAGKFLISCKANGFSRRAQLHEVSYLIFSASYSEISSVCSLYVNDYSEYSNREFQNNKPHKLVKDNLWKHMHNFPYSLRYSMSHKLQI